MRPHIRHPKDFWTGIIFLVAGLGAAFLSRDYPMGSAGRMGPGYFPFVLGGLLAIIGLIGVGRAFFQDGEPIGKFAIKELILVLIGILLFGYLVRGAGLVIAVVSLIMFTAYASPKFKWKHAALLAIGLAAFSVVVFVKLLGLPIAAIGPWFGYY